MTDQPQRTEVPGYVEVVRKSDGTTITTHLTHEMTMEEYESAYAGWTQLLDFSTLFLREWPNDARP